MQLHGLATQEVSYLVQFDRNTNEIVAVWCAAFRQVVLANCLTHAQSVSSGGNGAIFIDSNPESYNNV